MMKKGFLFCFLLFSILVRAQNYDLILGRPTNTAITLSILFDLDCSYFVQYGTVAGKYDKSTSVANLQANNPVELELTGLTPNTRYYYVLSYKPTGKSSFINSSEYYFQTQREKGSEFTFTIEADEHLYDKKGIRSMYKITLQNQLNDKPDFMFSLGDIFGDDHNPYTITSQELDALHKDYRQYLGNICHSVPFFIALGNHEGENDFYLSKTPPNNLAIWGTSWRKYYYPNPFPNSFYTGNTDDEPYGIGNPENYYAFTWGDALFVVLDAYRYQNPTSDKPQNWDWTLGVKQYNWLKSTLEGSTAKYKFVFAHHIRGQGRGGLTNAKLFEWGGYDADGKTWTFDKNRPGWAKPIHQLFKDNGVSIFFQGHDHLFAHEILDGIHYQEVPMPSDSTYLIGKLANADAYTSDTLEGTGHIRVKVNSACVKVDFVRAYLPADTLDGKHKNREVPFSYTIGSCTITAIQNIDNNQDDDLFTLYPNPSKSSINIIAKNNMPFEAVLLNSSGSMVARTSRQCMDISNQSPGMYILQLNIGKNYYNKKIIISR
jgi:hypothetical protein